MVIDRRLNAAINLDQNHPSGDGRWLNGRKWLGRHRWSRR
jgi:hypothetical protein